MTPWRIYLCTATPWTIPLWYASLSPRILVLEVNLTFIIYIAHVFTFCGPLAIITRPNGILGSKRHLSLYYLPFKFL